MPAFMPSAFRTIAVAAALTFALSGGVAHAQSDLSNRLSKLEQDVQRLQKQGGGKPAGAPDGEGNAELVQRILALESIVEQLTGQIEETRFNAERTAKQTKVLEDDVSLRLARIEQSLGMNGAPPAQQGQLVPAPTAAPPAEAPVAQSAPPTARAPAPARSAGDPMSEPVMQQPSARSTPVTPPPASAAVAGGSDGVNNNGGFVIRTDAAGRPLPPDPNAPQTPPPAAPPPSAQQAAPRAAPGPGPVTSGQIASGPAANVSLPEGTPKQQYEFAFDFLKRQDYPKAESALRDFLKRHPKDPLAGNAQYWLGETYYVRGDFQQAAVEFMAGYQNYPKTNKGPDNLLKLGMSMSKLNQTPGACTALSRIGKDYPDAPDQVLKQAQAERAKLKCK